MIYEMVFVAPQSLDDPLSDLLSGAGSMGVVLEDIGREAVFSPLVHFERCQFKGYFEETVNRRALEWAVRFLLMGHGEQGDCEIHWVALQEHDWQERWKAHFKPLLLGKKLLVLPRWLQPPEGSEDRIIIRIDPEMAFGSGTHETTWGCLEALESLAEQGPLGHVLDMGTGSGILIICAMLLGAEFGLAIDMDPIAVETCERNCQSNLAQHGYGERLVIQQASQLPPGPFQTVVANILAPALSAFLSQTTVQFCHCVAPGGHLLLSGLLSRQTQAMEMTACQNGFFLVSRRDIGDWSVLLLRRHL